MDKKHELERIAQASIAAHRRARSRLFREAAIGNLLDTYSIAEVTTLLREHASHLDEFG